ncbi:MAG: dihydrofolate reductase, partial [Lachnospiraceae bacterium]|nr:dihydrofolate reductase [Lachnospiraceae bacterium]
MTALIVAHAKNRVIGNKGQIPWRIKGEQKLFRELTTGNVVVMGRRSYEEIGRPLPNRYTIVVSNTQRYEADNCTTAGSLREAIEIAGDRDVYISGGAGLYRE